MHARRENHNSPNVTLQSGVFVCDAHISIQAFYVFINRRIGKQMHTMIAQSAKRRAKRRGELNVANRRNHMWNAKIINKHAKSVWQRGERVLRSEKCRRHDGTIFFDDSKMTLSFSVQFFGFVPNESISFGARLWDLLAIRWRKIDRIRISHVSFFHFVSHSDIMHLIHLVESLSTPVVHSDQIAARCCRSLLLWIQMNASKMLPKQKSIHIFGHSNSKQSTQKRFVVVRLAIFYRFFFISLAHCQPVALLSSFTAKYWKSGRFSDSLFTSFRFRFIQWVPCHRIYFHVYRPLSLMNLNCPGIRITTFPSSIVAGNWPIVWNVLCVSYVFNSVHPFERQKWRKEGKALKEITQFSASSIFHSDF